MLGEFQACMSITMSHVRKTEECAFETTSTAKYIICTFYDACHSDPRGRETIGLMIAISSDDSGGFRRGVEQFLGEELPTYALNKCTKKMCLY